MVVGEDKYEGNFYLDYFIVYRLINSQSILGQVIKYCALLKYIKPKNINYS